jgi:hypothetical protein
MAIEEDPKKLIQEMVVAEGQKQLVREKDAISKRNAESKFVPRESLKKL